MRRLFVNGGEQDSNLRRLSQQIYSLPRLTASVSPQMILFRNLKIGGIKKLSTLSRLALDRL